MIEFDRRQFEEYARAVFTTDSPSGCTADAIALIKSYVEELGYTARIHNKGTLEVDVPGLDNSKTVATSAHVDTLGLMVRSVKSGGTLEVKNDFSAFLAGGETFENVAVSFVK